MAWSKNKTVQQPCHPVTGHFACRGAHVRMARILRTSFSRIQRFRASNCKYCETYECLVPGNISMLCFRFSLLGKNKNRSQKNSWGWISYWGSMWILFLETLLPNCNSAYPNCGHSSAGQLCLKYDSSIGWTSYSEIGLTSKLSISIIFEMSLRMYACILGPTTWFWARFRKSLISMIRLSGQFLTKTFRQWNSHCSGRGTPWCD